MVFKNKMTFKNKCVVFTGSLQSMLRKDAIEKINAAGGIVKNYVSKETDYFFVSIFSASTGPPFCTTGWMKRSPGTAVQNAPSPGHMTMHPGEGAKTIGSPLFAATPYGTGTDVGMLSQVDLRENASRRQTEDRPQDTGSLLIHGF